MRIPDHAVINETVAATRALKKPWARGLVNAVLRKIAADDNAPERSVELPEWLQAAIEVTFPEQADALTAATTERAPMSLRVNVRRTTPEAYRSRLTGAGIAFETGYLPEHLVLDRPVPARDLPGHAQGLVSIQDAGAQLLTRLLPEGLDPRARILDACAAPGGKLFQLAERLPDAELVGVERSPERLTTLRQEAERLGHGAVQLVQGDATGRDWPGSEQSFDLILLDAPCSGTGTLRRHPDIKILRRPEDLDSYHALQLSLLTNLWPLVKPGGTLIYCTCSLLTRENDEVIDAFLETPHAEGQPPAPAGNLDLPTGVPTRHGWQLLPLPAGTDPPNLSVDGFYFARMTRREKAR